MTTPLSLNTQAILLLTAPLIAGKKESAQDLLSPGEYNKLARYLYDIKKQPADLLLADSEEIVRTCNQIIDANRLKKLLSRGFLLSQVVNQWQDRSIWVISRADAYYPRRIKMRLKEDAPPILYGCGDLSILNTEGLAVVGSRDVDEGLIQYTKGVAYLSAGAIKTIFSGGAKGVDQASMHGALENGGKAAGVLADSLEKTAMNRSYRDALIAGRLVLTSPYDPKAGFNVGNAMRRNKLIYALADAALVVNSDFNKGGTWTGAVEQLTKFQLIPVYVRSTGETSKGLDALQRKGALLWPNPNDGRSFDEALFSIQQAITKGKPIEGLFNHSDLAEESRAVSGNAHAKQIATESLNPAEELFVKVRELITEQLVTPKNNDEIAGLLSVSNAQAKQWLQRLVDERIILKRSKPNGYVLESQMSLLSSNANL